MTLAEQITPKGNGRTPPWRGLRIPGGEALETFARSPRITIPRPNRRPMQVVVDRVRAPPAITPSVSGAIGVTAIGLGVAGLFFPRRVKNALGIRAPTPVVQALFGAREMWSGYSLAGDPTKAEVLWARVGGDIFDIAVLRALDTPSNPRRATVKGALGFVLATTALDIVTAVRMSAVQRNCA